MRQKSDSFGFSGTGFAMNLTRREVSLSFDVEVLAEQVLAASMEWFLTFLSFGFRE